jgi:hypothetical protein
MAPTKSDVGRMSLTLTEQSARAIRLLATLRGTTQNTIAEEFLITGGLHVAMDAEFMKAMPEPTPQGTASQPVTPANPPKDTEPASTMEQIDATQPTKPLAAPLTKLQPSMKRGGLPEVHGASNLPTDDVPW